MLALELLAHFLETFSSPLVFGAIILFSCLSGSRNLVRAVAVAIGAVPALLAVDRIEPLWSQGLLVGLGMAAGALAAEIWISLVLPAGFALRRAAAALRRPHGLKRPTQE